MRLNFIMTDKEKIISRLTDIQRDIESVKTELAGVDITSIPREEKIRRQIEAIERFARADTPEEQAELDRFFAFMDAEEERKRALYDLHA